MPKRLPTDWTAEQKLEYKRELSRIRNKRYREKHGPEINSRWSKNNPEKCKASKRRRYLEDRERILQKQKAYYQANKDKIISYQKEYAKNNRSKTIIWGRKSRAKNIVASRNASKRWQKNKIRTDPVFRLTANLRRRLRFLVHRKTTRVVHLLGCSPADFRTHLESQFAPWMTWENYGFGHGKWVIDHIVPCSSFNLEDVEQQKKCFHYSNLRPLCWKENNRKSNSILIES